MTLKLIQVYNSAHSAQETIINSHIINWRMTTSTLHYEFKVPAQKLKHA